MFLDNVVITNKLSMRLKINTLTLDLNSSVLSVNEVLSVKCFNSDRIYFKMLARYLEELIYSIHIIL